MTDETIKEIADIFDECLDLGIKKSNFYSTVVDNIKITGMDGIATRLFDKASRLLSINKGLMAASKVTGIDETQIDTLKDMINYAVYGICLLRGKWDGKS